jgi:hypothetical protein
MGQPRAYFHNEVATGRVSNPLQGGELWFVTPSLVIDQSRSRRPRPTCQFPERMSAVQFHRSHEFRCRDHVVIIIHNTPVHTTTNQGVFQSCSP